MLRSYHFEVYVYTTFIEIVGSPANRHENCMSPAPSVICSLAPSMRETSMPETCDRLLVKHCSLSEDLLEAELSSGYLHPLPMLKLGWRSQLKQRLRARLQRRAGELARMRSIHTGW